MSCRGSRFRRNLPQVQRKLGPEALAKLMWGALRFDLQTYQEAATVEGRTRLHLAIVCLVALSNGFAYAMEATARGLLKTEVPSLYRLLVLVGIFEVLFEFVLFVGVVYLMRLIARRSGVGFKALCQLAALGAAPFCLLFIGPMVGNPEIVRRVLVVWSFGATVFALKVGTESSWITALLTVFAAVFVTWPVVNILLFGNPNAHPGAVGPPL
jgi:hypothetical protein